MPAFSRASSPLTVPEGIRPALVMVSSTSAARTRMPAKTRLGKSEKGFMGTLAHTTAPPERHGGQPTDERLNLLQLEAVRLLGILVLLLRLALCLLLLGAPAAAGRARRLRLHRTRLTGLSGRDGERGNERKEEGQEHCKLTHG